MSNIIPPLLSNSPPPPPSIDEEEDDEFGEFAAPNGLSYDCDNSVPSSPTRLPNKTETISNGILDINSNSKENLKIILEPSELELQKDFYDKRKALDDKTDQVKDLNGFNKFQTDVNETNELSEKVLQTSVNFEELSLDCKKSSVSKSFSELGDSIQSNFSLEDKKPNSVHEVNKVGTNCDIEETSEKVNNITTQENETSSSLDKTLLTNVVNIHSDLTKFSIDDSDSESRVAGSKSEQVNSFSDLKDNEVSSVILNQSHEINNCSDQELSDNEIEKESIHSQEDIETLHTLLDSFNNGKIEGNDAEYVTCKNLNESETHQVSSENSFDDFDDFGEFTLVHRNIIVEPTIEDSQSVAEPAQTELDDEFDDFADFTSSCAISKDPTPSQQNVNIDQEDDDFGDFASNSAFPLKKDTNQDIVEDLSAPTLLLNEKEAFNKSAEILKEMFPVTQSTVKEFVNKDFGQNDKIFNQIKNITETHALSFQWPKSASQNFLLKALNIDSRNILYGPGWNPSMPRFAANLSLTPLEPIKSEPVQPTVATKPTVRTSIQFSNNETLQLDFASLESAENLDSLSGKEATKIHDATDKIETSTSPCLELQESIVPEVSASPVGARKGAVEESRTNIQDDFDAFVSYADRTIPESSLGHNVLLRETHISTKYNKPEENDIVSWLEPTIVTPELARRERQFVEADDEFYDFHMTVPEEQIQKTSETPANLIVKPLENSTVNKSDTVVKASSNQPQSNDDDFGDFTFSLPKERTSTNAEPKIPEMSLNPAPVLEPLKPSIVHMPTTSTQISWPDPGISEEEIKRFETLSYSRVQNDSAPEISGRYIGAESSIKKSVYSAVVGDKSNGSMKAGPVRIQTKKNHVDDDEWSDFVSVQSSPIHKLKNEKERSSTPDLPLSVLNLGSIQPAKQPIPVITPNGLVQTKLSSNVSLNFPRMQVYPQNQGPHMAYQPSIISNQFVSQAFGGFGNYQGNSRSIPDRVDDDEWSDFVSHQPSKSTNKLTNQPNQMSNWVGATPNIITNPTANLEPNHTGESQRQKQKMPNSMQGKKNSVPTITMPDLDFFSPRTRTNRK